MNNHNLYYDKNSNIIDFSVYLVKILWHRLMNPIISAQNIHKFFGQSHVLKGVSLEVYESEIVSITGPSGAGKTTLLQILSSLDNPSIKEMKKQQIMPPASVEVQGTNILDMGTKAKNQFRNKEIGFIFQFHQLLPEFTVLENILMPCMIGKLDLAKHKERALYLTELLGIEDKVESKPTELSGGQQQRVAVARALINNPKIVFADEPSGNLDSHNAEQLHQLFFKLRDELNQTFVIVTHNPALSSITDRNIVMSDGMIESIYNQK